MSDWTPIEAEGGMKHLNGPAAVRAGDFVFLSSVKGVEPDTQRPSEDPETQLRQAFANVRVVLQAAGLDLGDIVKVTVYLKDPGANRPTLDRIWGEVFEGGTPPARATVPTGQLGGSGDVSIALFDVVAFGPV